MNKENAHLYLPFVQALVEGKTIQWKSDKGFWDDIHEIEFCMYDDPSCYRIKPAPRTFEMWLSPSGSMYPVSLYPNEINCKRITVQEVLE
jgi:hypothetical protein